MLRIRSEPADGRLGGFDVDTMDQGKAAHPSALDPGWQPRAARRTAGARPPAEPGRDTGQAGRDGLAALDWRRVRLTQRRTGRVHELVAVALQLGDLEAVGAVRATDWPGDLEALEGLQRDIEAGRSDEAMVHLKRAVALFAEIGEVALERDPGIWTLAAW